MGGINKDGTTVRVGNFFSENIYPDELSTFTASVMCFWSIDQERMQFAKYDTCCLSGYDWLKLIGSQIPDEKPNELWSKVFIVKMLQKLFNLVKYNIMNNKWHELISQSLSIPD